ncbi:MAG: glyoxalase [Flavobacterium sp.]|nr:glyoxalase [Flavobacterium sp.]
MEERENFIATLRGETIGIITNESSSEELFQNRTLRPIIKLQNNLLIQVYINYVVKQKSIFFTLSPDKKLAHIEHSIHRDEIFRSILKGIIIGFFTVEEYFDYAKNSSNLNKRMLNMICERLKSQVQLIVSQ